MPNVQPAHALEFVSATGILQVAHGRFASDAQFDLYFRDLAAAVSKLRAAHLPILMLSDITAMDLVCPEAANRIARFNGLFRAEDRIALIVRSSVFKLQLRRVAHDPTVQSFVSENAARTWLLAYNQPATSAA